MEKKDLPEGYMLVAIKWDALHEIAQCAGKTGQFSVTGKNKRFPLKYFHFFEERPFYFIESNSKDKT